MLFRSLAGEAELVVVAPQSPPLNLGVLSPGECFGEKVILLHNRLAETTVRACTDLKVLVVDGKHLERLLEGFPRLARDLAGVIDLRHRALQALQRDTLSEMSHVDPMV